MKLFLDTAHIEEIRRWVPSGLIDGITTNPTHLSVAGSPRETIKTICSLIPGDVSVEVTAHDPQDVLVQAREIARLASNIVVKIPCHEKYFSVMNELVREGIALNVTLVFSLLQATLVAKLGVKYISPFIGRWDDIDIDGAPLLGEIRDMLDTYGYESQLLAASIRHLIHWNEAIHAGADVVTIPPKLLEQALRHPLTDQGIARFDNDWKKLGITQFP